MLNTIKTLVRQLFFYLFVFLIVACLLLVLTGNGFVFSAVKRTYLAGHVTANINDHSVFKTKVIETAKPKPWPLHKDYIKDQLPEELEVFLEKGSAAAFLIVKDGKLLREKYFADYHNRSKTNSFSMAKTVTTLLTAAAIEDGYINSFEQPITDFLPEFKNQPLAKDVQVKHLSAMNSGYEWDENYYNAFSPTVALYYSRDVPRFLYGGEFSRPASDYFYYSSASTQLLGNVINRALKGSGKDFAAYLSEKIWKPLQMNDDALWHTDNTGNELAYCCLNTNARNFAKLGQLMLNNGIWEDQQVIPANFIQSMITPLGREDYGLSTWLSMESDPRYFWFSGHLGQYIIVIPEHNMIVVRLGETRSAPDWREESLPFLIKSSIKIASEIQS